MKTKRYNYFIKLLTIFCILFFLTDNRMFGQCIVVNSSNGWTAVATLTPSSVVPTPTNCPWNYNYNIEFDYNITFTGTTTNRSLYMTLSFACTGGSGPDLWVQNKGPFNHDTSGVGITTNASKQYLVTSGIAYDYSSNPSCSEITIADANCTDVKVEYWADGVPSTTVHCSFNGLSLPISLVSFEALPEDNFIVLKWVTWTENNNQYFILERSGNAEDWDQINKIPGAGTNSSAKTYMVIDPEPLIGTSYYRLKQVDYNNDYSYSPITTVDFSPKYSEDILVFPIPASTSLNIKVPVNDIKVILLNSLGENVDIPFVVEKTYINLNTNGLDPGIYNLVFSRDKTILQTKKICIIRQ